MEITEDTVAIVTGGASGLGAATVKVLASQGAKVSIFDMNRNVDKKIFNKLQVDYYDVDVSNAIEVAAAVNSVESKFKRLNVLVNCAGIGPAAKTVSRGRPHEAEFPSIRNGSVRHIIAQACWARNIDATYNCAGKRV